MTQTAVAQNSNRGNFSEIAGLLQSHQTRGCSRNRGNLTEVRLLDDNKLGIVTVVAVLYVLYAHIKMSFADLFDLITQMFLHFFFRFHNNTC